MARYQAPIGLFSQHVSHQSVIYILKQLHGRGEQSSTRILDPRFLSYMVSYDVASDI